ncbi:hypothetical protein L3X38_038113 [Prunus dulcis]|uniref:Uncharacterized protein n=1 Tax=Prunus dulcis TaxID=3755 RepID=A0AAD4V4F5_PRUDU|nr:hypothetical protein L3X38_038113 [Prunus dulcis]
MQDRGNELIGLFHFPTHPHLKLGRHGRHGATEQYDPGFGIVQPQQDCGRRLLGTPTPHERLQHRTNSKQTKPMRTQLILILLVKLRRVDWKSLLTNRLMVEGGQGDQDEV